MHPVRVRFRFDLGLSICYVVVDMNSDSGEKSNNTVSHSDPNYLQRFKTNTKALKWFGLVPVRLSVNAMSFISHISGQIRRLI